MTPIQEQLTALAAIMQAVTLVDKLARSGQAPSTEIECLLGSLLVRDPKNTLDVYGGDILNLREGYRALSNALESTPSLQRDALRYAMLLLGLERKLARRDDLLQIMGSRLDQIQLQVGHFSLTHENVIASFGALYQDTISTFPQRIQVQGDMRFLQQASTASKIRALLLTGIRAARLWRQLGGHRWQFLLSRGRLLKELQPLLRGERE